MTRFLSRNQRWPLLAAGALVLAAITPFWSAAIGSEFLRWDDRVHIPLNPWLTAGALSRFWLEPYYGLYIPVVYNVWTAMWSVFPHALAFKALNLALHATNTLLVWRLLARSGLGRTAALGAAALFAVHPLQIQSVAWISSGRDLLSAFFGLLALHAWLSGGRWLWAGGLAFALGLLCKPALAILPVVAWLWPGAAPRDRYRILTVGAWLALALSAAAITFWAQQSESALRLEPVAIHVRPLIAADAIGFYLWKFFWPLNLAPDYGRTPAHVLNAGWTGWVFAAIGATAVLTALARRRWPLVAIVFLTPVLGFVPFQAQGHSTVADHYMYLPAVGLAAAVAAWVSRRRFGVPALGGAVVALWLLSFSGSGIWATNRAFFGAMLDRNPDSYAAWTSMGVQHTLDGDLAEAERKLRRALEIKPHGSVALANLCQTLWSLDRPIEILELALPRLNDREFLRVNQNETRALSALHRLVARSYNRAGDGRAALSHYCSFLRMDPESADGRAEVAEFLKSRPGPIPDPVCP